MDHNATQMREQKAQARASARRILAQAAKDDDAASSSSNHSHNSATAAGPAHRSHHAASADAAHLVIQQRMPSTAPSHRIAKPSLQSNRLALMMVCNMAAHSQPSKAETSVTDSEASSSSSLSSAAASIPRVLPSPSNPDAHWTPALLGRFHCLLSAVRDAAPTPNSAWKYEHIKHDYEMQLAAHILAANSVPILSARRPSAALPSSSSSVASAAAGSLSSRRHQPADTGLDRYAFRSEMLRAVDSIMLLFAAFHSKQFDVLYAAPAPTCSEQLLHCAALLRRSLDALCLLGRTLDHIYSGLFQRLWSDRGRDLHAHLFLHSEISLLTRSWNQQVERLSEGYLEAQNAVLAKSPERSHASLLAASPLVSALPALSATSRSLSSLSSNFLCATRHASKSWCDALWAELVGNDVARGSTKGAESFLVRKHMPKPMPSMPVYSTIAAAAAGGGASSPSAADSTMLRASPSPSPPPAASPKDLAADCPSPLLPLLEDYFLPLCTAGGELCDVRSSGLVLSAVLDSVLGSFIAFLSRPRSRVRINAQGAARLNVELRWLWMWVHFEHIRANDRAAMPTADEKDAAAAAASSGAWPSASSPFLTSAGLNGSGGSSSLGPSALSSAALAWWRTCCVDHLSGTWSRVAAIVQVLMQPRSYAGSLPAKPKGSAAQKKKAIGTGADDAVPLPLWRWGVCGGGCGGSSTAAAEPQSSPSSSPAPAASASSPPPSGNRVAPLPPALTFSPSPSPSGGGGSLSPSPSPVVEAGSNVLVDSRGLALPDLSVWVALGMASQAHAKDFVAVGSAAVVDWPHRRG